MTCWTRLELLMDVVVKLTDKEGYQLNRSFLDLLAKKAQKVVDAPSKLYSALGEIAGDGLWTLLESLPNLLMGVTGALVASVEDVVDVRGQSWGP